ncbi:MAG TPA: secondary thiamine-phosphate synthase enzyme YjbQ [archaeon]|nr:secondary thiamine-phosphate synthase enzyme YjbQ [archaeon]
MIYRDVIKISTETGNFYDITKQVAEMVEKSGAADGLCNIFIKGTTASLMINENDRMLVEDFRKTLEKLIPDEHMYQHPDNAQSHLRASMLHMDLTIPVSNAKMILGNWQNILLWEFDVRPRDREIVITVNGV